MRNSLESWAHHCPPLLPPEAGGPRQGGPWAELRGSLWAVGRLRPRVVPSTCWTAHPKLGIISHHDRCGGSGVCWPRPTWAPLGLKPKPHAVRSPGRGAPPQPHLQPGGGIRVPGIPIPAGRRPPQATRGACLPSRPRAQLGSAGPHPSDGSGGVDGRECRLPWAGGLDPVGQSGQGQPMRHRGLARLSQQRVAPPSTVQEEAHAAVP